MRLYALVLLAAVACGDETLRVADPSVPAPSLPSADEVETALGGLELRPFIDRSFEFLLVRSPETIRRWRLEPLFDPDYPRLDDRRPTFVAETHDVQRRIRALLTKFDLDELSSGERLTHAVYAWILDDLIRDQPFTDHDYPVTGFVDSELGQMQAIFQNTPANPTEEDTEDYVRRLWQVDERVLELQDRLRQCDAQLIRPPTFVLDWALSAVGAIAFASPQQNLFYESLLGMVSRTPGAIPYARNPAVADARFIIESQILPAYQDLYATLEDIRIRAPSSLGVGSIPNGEAFYQQLIQHHTTTASSAEMLFAAGETDLARIQAEMRARFADLGYSPDLSLRQAFAQVAQDSGVIPADEVYDTYVRLVEDADARLPAAFDLLPSEPVHVVGGPSGGYYVGASLLHPEPGRFFAQTNVDQPRFAMPSLTYHEALPGHHLQVGLESDLRLPIAQRMYGFTAYREGWALYAEALAAELGWYDDDPYGDLGRLQWEALRAARLVVDTGIHAFGWTEGQAVAYLDDNLGFDPNVLSSRGQVRRYAARPGQALAYKAGMLRLQALRRYAEAELGPDFDLVAFHREVLRVGPVPIEILDDHVRAWVDRLSDR